MARSENTIGVAREAVDNELRSAVRLLGSLYFTESQGLIRDVSARDFRLRGMKRVLGGVSEQHENSGPVSEGAQDAREWLKGKTGTELAGYVKNLRGR